jgi:hypothetical protein
MTRDRANEVLFLWKVGAELFPAHVISQALYLTGDLSGPDLEADARLVRVPGQPAWVEGSSLAFSAGARQRASVDVLELAGATRQGDAA